MDNSEKPHRQEDYLALAEELRRVTNLFQVSEADRARLLSRPARSEKLRKRIKIATYTFFSGLGAVGLLALIILSVMAIRTQYASKSQGRITTCYFINQHKKALPWDHWHVYQSTCAHCKNEVVSDPRTADGWFKNREEAWNFMTKWKLTPCQ